MSAGLEPSSPHPRGDGPRLTANGKTLQWFSPPAWGWSAITRRAAAAQPVLPTRVGMVLLFAKIWRFSSSSPHPRGDGPIAGLDVGEARTFSPPAGGWSERFYNEGDVQEVLPTRVGMVALSDSRRHSQPSSPHPRGDGPDWVLSLHAHGQFSPPAWGWSAKKIERHRKWIVLPTRVGMVRASKTQAKGQAGSPHPRGDGPSRPGYGCVRNQFSPPAWGWSGVSRWPQRRPSVLPTRVGMVRCSSWQNHFVGCSPHPRGDGPSSSVGGPVGRSFSPPAWGWSGVSLRMEANARVLPTRVGMVRGARAPPQAPRRSPHPRGDGPSRPDHVPSRPGFRLTSQHLERPNILAPAARRGSPIDGFQVVGPTRFTALEGSPQGETGRGQHNPR